MWGQRCVRAATLCGGGAGKCNGTRPRECVWPTQFRALEAWCLISERSTALDALTAELDCSLTPPASARANRNLLRAATAVLSSDKPPKTNTIFPPVQHSNMCKWFAGYVEFQRRCQKMALSPTSVGAAQDGITAQCGG